MDEVDRRILNILERNSRTPYLEIAKQVEVSEGTVRRRVNKLIEDGTIRRFTIITAPIEKIRAFILVNVIPEVPTPEISEKIQQVTQVKEVYEVSGDYDIISFAKGNNIEEINDSVEKIRRVKGVANTVTTMVLR